MHDFTKRQMAAVTLLAGLFSIRLFNLKSVGATNASPSPTWTSPTPTAVIHEYPSTLFMLKFGVLVLRQR